MAYVSVDVDIDEFETEELVDELIERLKRMDRKGVSDANRKRLIDIISPLAPELNICGSLPNKTLDDKMKLEILEREWSGFTSFELEERLKKI